MKARSPRTWGALAVTGVVVAFSLSSTLVKRAESPGVLVAFWRLAAVSVVWNLLLWSTALYPGSCTPELVGLVGASHRQVG